MEDVCNDWLDDARLCYASMCCNPNECMVSLRTKATRGHFGTRFIVTRAGESKIINHDYPRDNDALADEERLARRVAKRLFAGEPNIK